MEQVMLRIFSLLATLVLVLSAQPLSAQTDSQGQVRTFGSGQVWVQPDQFSFELVVEARGAVSQKLTQRVNGTAKAIVEMLLTEGLQKQQVQSMQLEINPWFDRSNNSAQQQFLVSRRISVTMGDINLYPKILDKSIGLGASRVMGYHQFHSDRGALYQRALLAALEDARTKAKALADTAGASLGPAIVINEQMGGAGHRVMAARMESAVSGGFEPGEVAISAQVEVIYQIKP